MSDSVLIVVNPMSNGPCQGVVRGGVVEFRGDRTPADGTVVLVTLMDQTSGTSAAVLAAVAAAPLVPAEWVDDLEQLIAQGRRPPLRQIGLGGTTFVPSPPGFAGGEGTSSVPLG